MLSTILKLNEDRPLFPSLRLLVWHHDLPAAFQLDGLPAIDCLYRSLISPTLTSLALLPSTSFRDSFCDIDPWDSNIHRNDNNIIAASHVCENLQELTIHRLHNPSDSVMSISRFSNLQAFNIYDLPPAHAALINVLGQLPRLKTLHIAHPAQSPNLPTRLESLRSMHTGTSPQGPFPSLAHIHLDYPGTYQYISHILTSIGSSNILTTAYLDFRDLGMEGAAGIERCIQILGALKFSNSLRNLELRIHFDEENSIDWDWEGGQESKGIAFHEIFTSLFSLVHLCTLYIQVFNRFLLVSDADVERMSHSWPALTRMTISSDVLEPPSIGTAGPSIHALFAFIIQCKQLRALCIDAANITDQDLFQLSIRQSESAHATAATQTVLEELVFTRNEGSARLLISIPTLLAHLVHMVFPNVRGLSVLDAQHRVDAEGRPLEVVELGTRACMYLDALRM